MKKTIAYNILLLLSFLIIQTIQAKIIESNSIATILQYLEDPNTLVIFDIDNTLARPEHELGSDEWFCYQVNQKIAAGFDNLSAINLILPICYYAQFNLPLIPTESIIPDVLKNLAQQNICTMGLTSRSLYMAERTNEQLINIDINFHMPCTQQKELILPMKYPCLYTHNTIFAGNNDKGEALVSFLDTINYHPSCIIFVDDKMHHVQSIEKAALSRNIKYIGIRYSGCDEYINHFDPVKADLQLAMLKRRNTITTQKNYDITYCTKNIFWRYPLQLLINTLSPF